MSSSFQVVAGGDVLFELQRHHSDCHLTVVSVYAPTSKAPAHVKNKFLATYT